MTKLQELRELILKANPQIKYKPLIYGVLYQFTIAEVLTALKQIDETQSISIDTWGNLSKNDGLDWVIEWDLTKDLDGQSPETIESLLKILKGK